MDAREIESLSMLSRGFAELKEANPELAYNVILDILSGINEYVGVAYFTAFLLIVHCPAIRRCASTFKPRVVYSLTNASFARVR
jgi:serine/threonine-protein kinase 24/25/MST4